MISLVLGLLLPQPHRRTAAPRCGILDLPITPILPEICAKLESDPNLALQRHQRRQDDNSSAALDRQRGSTIRQLVLSRGVAARAAASRMAAPWASASVSASATACATSRPSARMVAKVIVVTEGVLTRRLLRDPALRGVGAIVFDEFHERRSTPTRPRLRVGCRRRGATTCG